MGVTRHRYAVDGWGVGEVVVADAVVIAHELPRTAVFAAQDPVAPDGAGVGLLPPRGETSPPEVTLADQSARVCADFVPSLSTGVAAELADRARAHLAGHATGYGDLPLDLSWCTDFQGELARALRGVPWGEIVSYGELAALAGRPGAARAAGSFCAHNRYALIVPCHRVVSSTGIGGYGHDGVALKRRLLALEGIEL